MAYIQMNVMSESLMRTVNINVILPADKLPAPGMPKPARKAFKTLYLLHGIIGSQVDWVNGTNIQRWAEEKEVAVVMPAGENMFYLDQERTHSLYGQFIGKELPDLMRRIFPLSEKREDTFIGGLSMGGYGALRNGLKYWENFSRIAGLSCADVTRDLEKRTDDVEMFFESRSFAESVFGDLSRVRGSDKDLHWLIGDLRRQGASLPGIYLACGVEDPLLEANRSLRDSFMENEYDITYEEGPGAHEWDFWNRYIKKVLDWLPVGGAEGINSGNVLHASSPASPQSAAR